MPEYSRPLGDAVKRARGKLGLTQSEVADAANIDVRTVLNMKTIKEILNWKSYIRWYAL